MWLLKHPSCLQKPTHGGLLKPEAFALTTSSKDWTSPAFFLFSRARFRMPDGSKPLSKEHVLHGRFTVVRRGKKKIALVKWI